MENKAEIVLVGSYHFEQAKDALIVKQEEISQLAGFLSKYNPIKIAVEWDQSDQEALDNLYTDTNRELAMNEIEQLGFTTAIELGHEKVFAVNWTGRLTEEDMTLLQGALVADYPDVLETMQEIGAKNGGISSERTLLDSYHKLNDPELINETERMYLSFIKVENAGENIGITFLNKWIERELTIVKNVARIVDSPNERILLIIGADHLWMLTKLFEGKGWKVINPFQNVVKKVSSNNEES